MDVSSTQKVGIGFAGLVLAHGSGLLAGIEHGMSPGVARTSLNLFHWLPESGWKASAASVQEAAKGSSGDRVAAKATCAFLTVTSRDLSTQDAIVDQINNEVPPEYFATPGLQPAIDGLATRLAGASEPGAYGHIYRKACFGIG
jgi:hypothetical protein